MRSFRIFSVALAFCLSAGCGGSDPGISLSSAKLVTAFGFRALSETGTIDGTAIKVTVPYGTDLTTLVADFTLSAEASASINGVAQVSGVTASDFTHPVTFTVRAADGSTQDYTVTVSVPDLVFAFGLQTLDEDPGVTVPAMLRKGKITTLPVRPHSPEMPALPNGATRRHL